MANVRIACQPSINAVVAGEIIKHNLSKIYNLEEETRKIENSLDELAKDYFIKNLPIKNLIDKYKISERTLRRKLKHSFQKLCM